MDRLESGSIVDQKALRVWRKVIETTEFGHHEPSGKIRLGFRASFPGDDAERGDEAADNRIGEHKAIVAEKVTRPADPGRNRTAPG